MRFDWRAQASGNRPLRKAQTCADTPPSGEEPGRGMGDRAGAHTPWTSVGTASLPHVWKRLLALLLHLLSLSKEAEGVLKSFWSAWEATAPIKIIRGSLQALIADFLMNSVCYCCIIKNLTGLSPWLLVRRLPPWNFLVYRSVCYSWAPWITPEFTLRAKVTEHWGCSPETPILWLEGWGAASPTAGWGVLTQDWDQPHGQRLSHSCLCN